MPEDEGEIVAVAEVVDEFELELALLAEPEPLLVVMGGMGLSRPTSTTSMFTTDEEHFVVVSLSPPFVLRFCGDNADWLAVFALSDDSDPDEAGGGGNDVSGEFVAEAFDDEVDVEDMELATVICGCIEANVCGDIRDKWGDKCANDMCG